MTGPGDPTLRERIDGGLVVSIALDHPSSAVAEFLAVSRLAHAYTIDLEHGNVSDDRIEDVIRVASLNGVPTIVRVPLSESSRMQRLLDVGAIGWKVPDVTSVEVAEEAVSVAKHPPLGRRGIGRTKATAYGRMDYAEASSRVNRDTVVMAIIESVDGVDKAAAIAAVDGIDVLVVGLVDLSASMGITGQTDHPDIGDAVSQVKAATENAGKTLGLVAGSPAGVKRSLRLGARFLTVPLNGLIETGLEAFGAALDECLN